MMIVKNSFLVDWTGIERQQPIGSTTMNMLKSCTTHIYSQDAKVSRWGNKYRSEHKAARKNTKEQGIKKG